MRLGLLAAAMIIAVGSCGCVITPTPVAESVVAGSSGPTHGASASPTSGAAASGVTAAPLGDAPPPVPVMPPAPDTPPPPPKDPPAPQTSAERRAALDKQLNDSLGAFDDRLHKEQQKTAEERDARQATVAATTAATDGSGSSSPGAGDGSAGTAATEAGSGAPAPHGGKLNKRGEAKPSRAGDLKSDKAGGSPAGNGAPATIVPDGNDDDIVARRLRKAAEQETDPELKDKLWKEYVEYKKNTPLR